jgi:hypothetical protein
MDQGSRRCRSWVPSLAQLLITLVAVGLLCLLVALHNPFGGYQTVERVGAVKAWRGDFRSVYAVFPWIETPLQLLGYAIPLVVFACASIGLVEVRRRGRH